MKCSISRRKRLRRKPPNETEEPVAVAEEVTSEMTSDDGAEATPVKTPRARKPSGTDTARRKQAATTDAPAEQEVPATAD
jgi:hypothetical protein